MIKVGVVGGTGYTGSELLRLLITHPDVHLQVVTSRAESGKPLATLHPQLFGHTDQKFENLDSSKLNSCDVVFFATPNGTAMQLAPAILDKGMRVIDLAADFRLHDSKVWEKWYGQPHVCPDYLQQAVYGLPELFREKIKGAQLVANPGCYPTAVVLGLVPLLESGIIHGQTLIADAKSGVSGAGRSPEIPSLFSEAGENFKAYKVTQHRHWPEIMQTLTALTGDALQLIFTPHLVPMVRGIHATLYATIRNKSSDLQLTFERRFANEPFVQVLPTGEHPQTKSVRGTNICQLAVHQPVYGNVIVVLSVIDNLVKGAAGQAIQNMNIMCGLKETQGLINIGLSP